jgi:hypothetical protein
LVRRFRGTRHTTPVRTGRRPRPDRPSSPAPADTTSARTGREGRSAGGSRGGRVRRGCRWPPGPGTVPPRPGRRSLRSAAAHRHTTGGRWGDPGPSVPRHIPWSHRVRRPGHLHPDPHAPPVLAARPVWKTIARAGVVPEGQRSTKSAEPARWRRPSSRHNLPPPTDGEAENP